MILDSLLNLEKYEGVIPHVKEIAKFLRENDGALIPAGRYDVTDGVFVNVCDIENGVNNGYEAHRKYSDLQCLITGDEIMKRCHIDACSEGNEYSDEHDCIIYMKAKRETVCHVYAGEFAFFEPEDAHSPGTRGDVPSVRKLIFKIPVKG